MLEDEDGDYNNEIGLLDVVTTERLSRKTDRGAWWCHVQQLLYESDQQCYDFLRINQRNFEALCKMLTEWYVLQESHNVHIEEYVVMFL